MSKWILNNKTVINKKVPLVYITLFYLELLLIIL